MSGQETKKVFICYSHEDRSWLDKVQQHLRPLVRDGTVDLWDDTRLDVGQLWREEIGNALYRAEVAILLISRSFFASEFIASQELPVLLENAKKRGTHILCVILRPCRFARDKALSKFQAVNSPNEPWAGMKRPEQDRYLDTLANRVEHILGDDIDLDREPVEFRSSEGIKVLRLLTFSRFELPEDAVGPDGGQIIFLHVFPNEYYLGYNDYDTGHKDFYVGHKTGGECLWIFASIEGFFIRSVFVDIDGDGFRELIVESALGAHTRWLHIFKIRPFVRPELYPGGMMPADGGGFILVDRNEDGRCEIYTALHAVELPSGLAPEDETLITEGRSMLWDVYDFEDGLIQRVRENAAVDGMFPPGEYSDGDSLLWILN